jgi:hypothetical protein
MRQQRQIIKTVDKEIHIEDLVCTKYAAGIFHSISCMLISVIVTINRTVLPQKYQTSRSHFIMMPIKVRNSV